MNKQNSKKIAICFFGLSKCKDGECRRNKKCMEIDHFKYNYDNYQEKIFDYFLGKGYKIDVYFSTNDTMNDIDKNKLINAYKPINYNFIDENLFPVVPVRGPSPLKMASKHRKVENVLEMCLDSKIDYDLVLLTRFDLIFNDNFNESNIELDKFNIVSELESKHVICDNFYLVPFKYLREFLEIAKDYRTTLKGYHVMRGSIEKRLNTEINMIKNEKKPVLDLTFYKISYLQNFNRQ